MSKKKANNDLVRAHKHSSGHKPEVQSSRICGCFYCSATFPPDEILEWVGRHSDTALCPKCGIDAVLGDRSGWPVSDRRFLKRMSDRWFKP